ncbi:MAG: hypothetical protein ACPLKP_00055 [Microgenomates group bacterium]
MLSKKIEEISWEYYQKYKDDGIKVNFKRLLRTAKTTAKRAERNYSKLESPRTSCKEIYILHWVRETLSKGFVIKTLQKIDIKSPPSEPYFQAISDYFRLLPPSLIRAINLKINNTPPPERERLWKTFNFPLNEIKEKFARLILLRRDYLLKKKGIPILEIFLKQFKIPKDDFEKFIKNQRKIINLCNKLLPKYEELPSWFYSEFNFPCYICRMSNFPFKNLNEIFNFVSQEYPLLAKFKSKVKTIMGNCSQVRYEKKTDCFLITIDKYNNFRHQAIDFIHELGHVVNFLKDFKNCLDPLEKGKYYEENEAIKIEFSMLKKSSKNLFKANLARILGTFWKTIFEIMLYKNPNQDIEKLYADTFNMCFKGAKQKRNPFYILDENIITSPFSSLPHAIVYCNLISEMKILE